MDKHFEKQWNDVDLQRLDEVAIEVMDLVKKGRGEDDQNAVVLLLCGEMGAGKTTFAQAIGRVLGIEEKIVSPTFVIERQYKINDQLSNHNFQSSSNDQLSQLEVDHPACRSGRPLGEIFNLLIHYDLWRVPDGVDSNEVLDQMGIRDALKGKNLVIIEWPERLKGADFGDVDVYKIEIQIAGEKRNLALSNFA